jgi:hypothetical protein
VHHTCGKRCTQLRPVYPAIPIPLG